jgi:hypothetical protein
MRASDAVDGCISHGSSNPRLTNGLPSIAFHRDTKRRGLTAKMFQAKVIVNYMVAVESAADLKKISPI